MPWASVPKAPCVDVCESPHTIVMPGSVAPCSGPIMCTMPWRMSFILNSAMPLASQFASSVSTCSFETGSAMPLASQFASSVSTCSFETGSAMPFLRFVVGTL